MNSIVARAADDKCFVLMASLDLSMVLDLVNTELLVKRQMNHEMKFFAPSTNSQYITNNKGPSIHSNIEM